MTNERTVTDPNEPLAREFAKQLLEEIGPEKLQQAVALNAAETDDRVCHSHDDCDANQVMLNAFEVVHQREAGQVIAGGHHIQSLWDYDMDRISAAWTIAKRNNFWQPGPGKA